ncbi:sensor histidine kinase [Trueperella bialowiezensis]|nr:HAMP domain-containing sensor histidine kinase [Trueperella bialowiezensis]
MSKTKPKNYSRIRLIGYITGIIAVALILLVVMTSFVQRRAIQNEIHHALDQEASEINQFAASGIDPATGEAFTSPQRFLEVYLERQVTEPSELIVGGVPGQGIVNQQVGAEAQPFETLSPDVQELLKVPGSSGTITDPQAGTLSWLAISVDAHGGQGVFSVVVFHKSAEEQLSEQILWMALLALATLIVTALVTWQLSDFLVAHVGKFEREADRAITATGVAPLPTSGGQEYSRLATAANRLLESAEADVDRERQFAEDLSYALRTPLALVDENLSEVRSDPTLAGEKMPAISAEISRLRGAVDTVSELGTLARQRYLITEGDVDVARFVQAYVTNRLEEGDVIAMDDSPTGLLAAVDVGALRRALDEVVDNAYRASEPGSLVNLAVTPERDSSGRWARITVSDEGRGIPAGEEEHVLLRFAVASNDPQPGHGLGLALAQGLVAGLKGRIAIANNAGRGARVDIDIPLAASANR